VGRKPKTSLAASKVSVASSLPAIVVDPPIDTPLDPVISITHSQLLALIQDAQSTHLDINKRIARFVHHAPVDVVMVPSVIQDAIKHAKEPRRQRKVRAIKARVGYVLKPIKSKQQFTALHNILPGEAQVLSYVATHRRPSVQDIAAGTELSAKTVKNYVSTLVQKNILASIKL